MENINKSFFDELEKRGIKSSPEQRAQINSKLSGILNYTPKIGIFGKTGAGKSSLCNALFGTDICKISDVEACTRDPQKVTLNMGKKINLLDVPGVGENGEKDIEYGNLYASLLPKLDLVLWLIKGDDRALASDENFYKNVVKPHIDQGKPFFFVLNQVDKIEPFREWNEEKHEPGPNQFQNIHRKINDVARYFDVPKSKIIPVSANEKYNLLELVDEFVRALPREKKITVFSAVDEEFQSKATGKDVKKSFLEIVDEIVGEVLIGATEVVTEFIDSAIDRIGDFFSGVGDFFSGLFGGWW